MWSLPSFGPFDFRGNPLKGGRKSVDNQREIDPVGTIAPLVPYACALALAGVSLYQRGRMAKLRARIADGTRTDSLTGLLNRRALEEMLDMELESATRAGRPLSVIVGDLYS